MQPSEPQIPSQPQNFGVVPPAQPTNAPPQPVSSPESFNQKNKKSGAHKIAIIVAVLTLVLISSALVYFFIVKNEKPTAVDQPQPQPAPTEQIDLASPEGVDQTIKSIDQSLNSVNDQADFTPNDVSDDTLGL